jgi:hypothetical protein
MGLRTRPWRILLRPRYSLRTIRLDGNAGNIDLVHSRLTGRQTPQSRWQHAIVALAGAQLPLTGAERFVRASDAAFRRAWLGLPPAQRYQLALARREHYG